MRSRGNTLTTDVGPIPAAIGQLNMEAMGGTGRTKAAVVFHLGIPLPCLLAILAAACSVDVSRLRPPTSVARDAPTERGVGSDISETAGADGDGDAAVDQGSDQSIEDASGGGVIADAMPDAPDLPLPGVDGTDSASDGGKGDDADRSDDSGPVGNDGAGGMGFDGGGGSGGGGGALGGAGGSGGSGGAAGTGGAGGDSDAGSEDADDPGLDGAGATGGSGGVVGSGGTGGTVVDPDLVLWYRFDESSGNVAVDSSASGAGTRNGSVVTAGAGSSTFSTDCQVGTHALRLTPSSYGSGGGYVTTPAPASLAPGAMTIALWVKLAAATSAQDWARIFDFGSGTGSNIPYLYLTTRASDAAGTPPRFGMSLIGHVTTGEQRLEGTSALTANVWHHLAVVLPAGATYTGTLYIDGVAVATNDAMTIHPSDIGPTTQNWLGRSPFTSDPYFSGSLDDFRIYKRALSAAEIVSLTTLR